ncbi:hypothetical protein Lfu02_61970 [Longispora fulva]|uniref:Uncharacterized protein n=1 Tax=Longispora fulva TaxID=619741 RepID=A0A8J7GF01_9ACTN|nr:hypothetical protein [Longispora fulva]MBG6134618.1 hypothetical protein [Longispora fulva]GIG61825.1 hypothetical protein Lfu02_61970 [Longispora fulva]
MSGERVAGSPQVSPITALIRLLAELVLDVHKPTEGVDVCRMRRGLGDR